MTNQYKRCIKRRKKNRKNNVIRWLVHMMILIVLGLLILSNQFGIITAQEDTLNALSDMRIELDKQSLDNALESLPEANLEPTGLTTEERDLVCRVVAAEARGEDLQGQMAVAQTIRDRSTAWDMTPTEVVQAPGQYAKPFNGEISDSVKLAVANIFDGQMSVLDIPTTHFHTVDVHPYWTSSKESRGSIGIHRFWY